MRADFARRGLDELMTAARSIRARAAVLFVESVDIGFRRHDHREIAFQGNLDGTPAPAGLRSAILIHNPVCHRPAILPRYSLLNALMNVADSDNVFVRLLRT